MLRSLAPALALSFSLVGCSKGPAATPDQPGTLAPVELPSDHPPLTPIPDPEMNGGHAGRAPRPSSHVPRNRRQAARGPAARTASAAAAAHCHDAASGIVVSSTTSPTATMPTTDVA